jgi:hypothetical protein
MSPPADRPHDLVDQIEMIEEQPLIIHVSLSGNLSDYDAPESAQPP